MTQKPSSQPTVLLFDVDRTLVDNGGAGRKALARTLDELYGEADWLDFPLSGMTDQLIVRRALERTGEPASAVGAVIQRYLQHLERELAAAGDLYVVNPGVVQLLERAQALDHLALGLGTGNVEPGARLKLAPGGLNRFFAFGGFGSDALQRADLLSVGAARGAERLGLPVAACRIVVIGDTPLDVAAALAIGAESVGVATGTFDRAALLESGAHHALRDLEDPAAATVLLR